MCIRDRFYTVSDAGVWHLAMFDTVSDAGVRHLAMFYTVNDAGVSAE